MRALAREAALFAGVGVLATLLHVAVAALAHWALGLAPQGANLAGFAVASAVTYYGNQRWTFGGRARHAAAARRFPVMAAASLGASSLVTWLATALLGWSYGAALALVAVTVPGLTFLLAKIWVFRAD